MLGEGPKKMSDRLREAGVISTPKETILGMADVNDPEWSLRRQEELMREDVNRTREAIREHTAQETVVGMTDQSEHQGTGVGVGDLPGQGRDGEYVGEPGAFPPTWDPYKGRRPYPIPPGFPGGRPIPTPARRQELLAFAQGIVAGADGQVAPDEMPLVFQFVTLLIGE